MKRGNAILLSSALLASLLCGCGQAAPSAPVGSGASSTVSSGAAGTSGSVGVLDAAPAAPTAEPAAAGQPISLLFSKATGVSREWQDGKFIINGLDASGNKICGIADSSGNAVLVDGYTALYPLADGHLLATTEADASGECDYEGKSFDFNSIGFSGVILDENLAVVYQPDGSFDAEKLYPINSHIIFSIRVKRSFDGNTVSMCALNQKGDFLYDCSYMFDLSDCIVFNDAGDDFFINHTFSSRVQFGTSDLQEDNRLLRISISAQWNNRVSGIVFNEKDVSYTLTSDLSKINAPNYLIPYDSSHFISGGISVDNGKVVHLSWELFPSSDTDFSGLNAVQSAFSRPGLESIKYVSHFNRNGISSAIFLYSESASSQPGTLLFEDGTSLNVPENYLSSLYNDFNFASFGDSMLLVLRGADNSPYCTFVTADGTAEPFLVGYYPSCAIKQDSTLILGSSGGITFFDADNGQKVNEISLSDSSLPTAFSILNNKYLVVTCNSDDATYYKIYSLTDNSLIL